MYYIDRIDQKLKQLRDCFAGYRAAGLGVCRLDPEEKNPLYRGWSTVSLDDPELFDVTDNIGILTGWLSDGGRPGHALVVIDLDAMVAILAADSYLPATGMIEGRPGKPRSHRYYLVPIGSIPPEHVSTAEQSAPAALAAGKHPGPAKQQFRDREGAQLVEVLGSGQQAAAPPSVHPSGEVREWEGGTMGKPAVVPWPDLLVAVRRLAASCGWVPEEPRAGRNDKVAGVPRVPEAPAAERFRRAKRYMTAACGGTGIPGTQEGTGARAKAFGLASRLVNGFDLDPEEALPLLLAWGQRDDQLDHEGNWFPWDEDELYRFLVDADRKGDHEDRPRGYLLADRDEDDKDDDDQERPAGRAATGGRYADWFARHRRRMSME
jgi:hypothetical protein